MASFTGLYCCATSQNIRNNCYGLYSPAITNGIRLPSLVYYSLTHAANTVGNTKTGCLEDTKYPNDWKPKWLEKKKKGQLISVKGRGRKSKSQICF